MFFDVISSIDNNVIEFIIAILLLKFSYITSCNKCIFWFIIPFSIKYRSKVSLSFLTFFNKSEIEQSSVSVLLKGAFFTCMVCNNVLSTSIKFCSYLVFLLRFPRNWFCHNKLFAFSNDLFCSRPTSLTFNAK